MDLKSLQSVSEKLSSNRSRLGGDACKKAYGLLAEVQLGGFHDKASLNEAVKLFSEAIKFSRSDVDAYLGMGYVLMLLPDYGRAERYLLTAIRLDRHNSDAQALLDALISRRQRRQTLKAPHDAQLAASTPTRSEADWDRFYDQVDAAIRDVAMRAAQFSLSASCEPAGLQALSHARDVLAHDLREREAELRSLEAEFEVDELRQQLLPIEQTLAQVRSLIGLSQEFLAVRAEIAQARRQVEADNRVLSQSRPGNLAGFEAGLEGYFNQCDALADRLDAWEAAGHPVQTLMQSYEHLILSLESYQELLDGLAETLAPSNLAAAGIQPLCA